MTARELIEAEDPKAFLLGSQLARYQALIRDNQQLLAAFCNDVEELLQATDSGNAEDWPPPEGFPDAGDFGDAGLSRWNHVWKELQKIRAAFKVHE